MSKDNGGPASDKIQQARRAAFEKWFMTTRAPHAPEDLWLRRDEFGHYFVRQTFAAWEGFNAALDCVVIELPSERTKRPGFMHETLEDSAHNNCRDLCADAIESTSLGIKVK